MQELQGAEGLGVAASSTSICPWSSLWLVSAASLTYMRLFFSLNPSLRWRGFPDSMFFFRLFPSDSFQVSFSMAESILDSKGRARRKTLPKTSSKPLPMRARIFVQNGKAMTLKPARRLRPPGSGSRRSSGRNFFVATSRDHLWVSHSRSEMCSWDQIDHGARREKQCMTATESLLWKRPYPSLRGAWSKPCSFLKFPRFRSTPLFRPKHLHFWLFSASGFLCCLWSLLDWFVQLANLSFDAFETGSKRPSTPSNVRDMWLTSKYVGRFFGHE